MKIIFTKDSDHGKKNEVKDVADGLANNLLIKKGFAIKATPENMAKLKRAQEKEAEEKKEWDQKVDVMMEALTKDVISIEVVSKTKEKMNGSLKVDEIAKTIKEKLGFEIDKKMIKSEKINTFGINYATINFGHGKQCEMRILLKRVEA
jgi:large subunit ribosomal protein L9